MKINTPLVGLVLFVCALLAPLRAADAEKANALVVKATGVATAQLPGKAEPVTVAQGLALPAGSVIITGSTAEIFVQVFSGSVVTIKPNSTISIDELSQSKTGDVVTKQTTRLNLRSGNVISTIDPAKKGVTDYSVRTPKGVAAARGTSYSIGVAGNQTTVAATADTVTFTTATGTVYAVQAGLVSVTLPSGEVQPPVPISSVMSTDSAVGAMLSDAVTTLATIIQNNLGELSADSVTNLASQLVAVASSAMPDSAPGFTSSLVTAIATANSAASSSPESAAVAVAAVTAAAVQSAPGMTPGITTAAVSAAPQYYGAIVAAATQTGAYDPGAIVQAVAQAMRQTATQVQNAADQAAAIAARGVASANTATQNVATPPASAAAPGSSQNSGNPTPTITTEPMPIDTVTVSNAT